MVFHCTNFAMETKQKGRREVLQKFCNTIFFNNFFKDLFLPLSLRMSSSAVGHNVYALHSNPMLIRSGVLLLGFSRKYPVPVSRALPPHRENRTGKGGAGRVGVFGSRILPPPAVCSRPADCGLRRGGRGRPARSPPAFPACIQPPEPSRLLPPRSHAAAQAARRRA